MTEPSDRAFRLAGVLADLEAAGIMSTGITSATLRTAPSEWNRDTASHLPADADLHTSTAATRERVRDLLGLTGQTARYGGDNPYIAGGATVRHIGEYGGLVVAVYGPETGEVAA
jgi:hypothetical protein